MKNFRVLTKESGRFCLAALAVMLFLMLCDAVYILRDNRIALTGQKTDQMIRELIEKEQGQDTEKILQTVGQGKSLEGVINDKAEGGFLVILLGIMVMLGAKEFYYMDIRAQEYRRTLPVKTVYRVLYGYFSMLGILLVGLLAQGVILLICQNHYNRTVMNLLGSTAGVPENMVSANGGRFLQYAGIYLLFIVLVYTWMYLGMTLTKNPIAGMAVSLYIWWGCCMLEDEAAEYVILAETAESVTFYPAEFFWNLNMEEKMLADRYPLDSVIVLLVVSLLVMIALIALAGGEQELSGGKLFYFPVLDYPFAAFSGIVVFMVLVNSICYWCPKIAVIAGLAATVFIWWLLHPQRGKKAECWEVK
ncbi:MAG: hypothetical protein NC300_11945 [Bacteroidales bacterium]|nr:hypothetical protein [Clostridium sp.]MCM1204844.1 hypothetical protein [Bacteroidales bacterium]